MEECSSLPFPLTPEQRRSQVATILARGVLRIRLRSKHRSAENSPDSDQPGLEVVSDLRLCVSHRPAK